MGDNGKAVRRTSSSSSYGHDLIRNGTYLYELPGASTTTSGGAYELLVENQAQRQQQQPEVEYMSQPHGGVASEASQLYELPTNTTSDDKVLALGMEHPQAIELSKSDTFGKASNGISVKVMSMRSSIKEGEEEEAEKADGYLHVANAVDEMSV